MVELPGLDRVAGIVDPVAREFVAAGYRIYLVGGVVRDLVLAADDLPAPGPNDIDLTTDASPAEIKRLVSPLAHALWSQGERFGTIGAKVGEESLEITTHRAEAYDPDSRKPIVTFGTELVEDLSRRDFTINAMAVELPGREVHDPYHGMADLAGKLLRTPLSPEVSFSDDPLRIMRAARFTARFGLVASPDLVSAATQLSDRLAIVSVERVADELERLLTVDDPGPGLRFLAGTGALGRIVAPYRTEEPERADLATSLAAAPGDPGVRRAGLLWPIRARAGSILAGLRYSLAEQRRTRSLLGAAELGLAPTLDRAGVRRIAAVVGIDELPALATLVTNIANHDPSIEAASGPRLVGLIDEVRQQEDLSDLGGPLSGDQIIDILGLEPGPAVGFAKDFLTEYRLVNGPMSPMQAREVLLSWWQERGDGDDRPTVRYP